MANAFQDSGNKAALKVCVRSQAYAVYSHSAIEQGS